jgi:transmembrane sensor
MASSTSKPARPDDARRGTPPLDWARPAGTVGPVLAAVEKHLALNARRRRRRLAATAGAAAALALLVVAGLALRPRTDATATTAAGAHRAVVSQPERQVLADGSVVELRGDAALTVDFRPELRRVVLARGEAHFAVAKDAARPFVVEAGGVGVRAVGTEFSVQLGAGSVDVLVTEGRVAVADAVATAAATTPTFLDAGQRVAIAVVAAASAPAVVQPVAVSPAEIDERLAWRVPRLEFSATPLAEVVALFNAHAGVAPRPRLALGDPALASLPLSGRLRADNVSVLLSILESSYGLKAEPGADGTLVLRR